MSNTPVRIEQRAYHETPEHYAARIAGSVPAGTPLAPQGDVKVQVRNHLVQQAALDGLTANPATMREDQREAVVVSDDQSDWRLADPGEVPTGHMILWSIEARERVASDDDEPVIEVAEEGGQWVARFPEPQATDGGSVRVRHNLGEFPTLLAKAADGSHVDYLLATYLDEKTIHVDLLPGAAYAVVSPE